jgi:class 3 adenylate cyclase
VRVRLKPRLGSTIGVLEPLTLRFEDRALEAKYQSEAVDSVRRESWIGSLTSIGLWLAGGVLIPSTTSVPPSVSTPIVLVMAGANAASLLPIRRMRTIDDALRLLLALNILTGIGLLALASRAGLFERYAGPAIMLQSTFALFIARRFVLTLVAAAVELGLLIAIAVWLGLLDRYLLDLFIVVSALTVGIGATYVIESSARGDWFQRRLIASQQAELEIEKGKSDRLLRNVLPDAIAERLREHDTTIADAIDDATVLFADLVGFTPLAARLPPGDTVEMLDALFGRFDDLTDRFGLAKIKTIGDAYMAAGGVPTPLPDHPERVVRMGLAMLEATAEYGSAVGVGLELRVGVHTGPVVAGVIGRRRFSYDLWGDTVNVASRMESHGVAGAVQISRATRDRLGATFRVKSRGRIDVKGKSSLEAFLVVAEETD